jgi:hypothetical protein
MHQAFVTTPDRAPLSLRFNLRIKGGVAQTQDCLRASRLALAGTALSVAMPTLRTLTASMLSSAR